MTATAGSKREVTPDPKQKAGGSSAAAKPAAKKPTAKKPTAARKPTAKKPVTRKPAARVAAPKGDGGALMDKVVAAAKAAKVPGEFAGHKGGAYARLKHGGRTVAYVVKGKTVATVYPNCLAAGMPPDVRFRKVELGAHHYGRGEVVVSVESDGDIGNAVAALRAATKADQIPREKKAA